MSTLVGTLLIIFEAILQSAVVSRVTLLQGTADIVLLTLIAWGLQAPTRTALAWAVWGGFVVGYVSELPIWVPLISYLLAVGLALLLRPRIWQLPTLLMLLVTFCGTLTLHLFSLLARQLSGTEMPMDTIVSYITLPSMLLNFLLALPMYALIGDLSRWLYPPEIEV
jgi:cell shape-determining protein MreD